MRFKVVIFLVFFFSSLSTFAKVEKEDWGDSKTIIWTTWNSPPVFINSGKFKGKGLSDRIQSHIVKLLPEYKHKVLSTNIPRIISLAEQNTNTCNVSWLDTPDWRKMFHFSLPYIIVPTNGIIVRKSNRHLFGEEPISFERLMMRGKMKLGIARLYGEGLDEVLYKYNYKNNPQVSIFSDSKHTHKMLMNERVDYILGYPFEASFYRKTIPDYNAVSIALKENPNSVLVVFGCSKSPWGKRVIELVNEKLKLPRVRETYRSYVNDWLDKNTIESMRNDEEAFIKKFYSK